jgi:P-type E1-E2 ATPase
VDGDLLLIADGRRVASFTLGDVAFPDSHGTVRDLRQRGLLVGLVSGDKVGKVTSLAVSLGIEEERVFAEQSPNDKVTRVQNRLGGLRAMVGNGFNDSLAMAHSDVGVAVAEATQQVKDSADVCLVTPGTTALVSALELSEQAKKKIYGSFVFAIFFNLTGLSLAAAGHMHPVVAAVLMPFSSLSVIAIATRWKLRQKAQ